MQTALNQTTYIDNIIPFPNTTPPRRTTSLFKSDGKPKATEADPIRDVADIKAIQDYYLSRNQIRNYTLFTMGILFGLRAGDLLSLRIHHIKNPDGTFKSHCDLIESKRRKFNNPAITPELRRILTAYLDTCDLSYHDPLFPSRNRNPDGSLRPLDLSQFYRILRTAVKACNIPGHISTHSLRKTFAYQMIQQNPNSDEVKFFLQKMLNHDSFGTTLTYCGITQDGVDRYRMSLEEIIK